MMIPPCVLFELGFLEIFSRFRRFSGRPLELAGKGWKRREGERLLLPRGLKQRLLKMRNGGVPAL